MYSPSDPNRFARPTLSMNRVQRDIAAAPLRREALRAEVEQHNEAKRAEMSRAFRSELAARATARLARTYSANVAALVASLGPADAPSLVASAGPSSRPASTPRSVQRALRKRRRDRRAHRALVASLAAGAQSPTVEPTSAPVAPVVRLDNFGAAARRATAFQQFLTTYEGER